MKKLIFHLAPLLLAAQTSTFAGADKNPVYKNVAEPEVLFKNNELQVDVFASYGYGENERKTKTTTETKITEKQIGVVAPPVRIRPEFRSFLKTTVVSDGRIIERTTERSSRTRTTGQSGLFGQDNAFGGGIGVNYFFARYFGIGAEADWLAGNDAIHLVNGSAFFRYPVNLRVLGKPRGLAPYAFAGYGAKFDGVKWGIGHVGGGIEFRITQSLACFVDGRFIYGHRDAETGLFRTGLRVIF